MHIKNTSIKNLEQRHVAYVSFIGDYMWKPEIFKNLFEKLGNWAGPKNLIDQNTVFLPSYKDDPYVTPPDKLTLEACMSIPEGTEVEWEIQKKDLPCENMLSWVQN